VFEGFNESSKKWYSIDQCPSAGVNGPMDWEEFVCGFAVEANITKVRPVLVSGWSSQPNKEAITWFDSIYLTKFRPFLTDPRLMAQVVYDGLSSPVTMAFLGPDDFLVAENNGTVQRIVNGSILAKPILQLNVTGDGLLGIATSSNIYRSQNSSTAEPIYVFLYYVTKKHVPSDPLGVTETMWNNLHRYELVNNTLANPRLLLELPAGYNHNGGPILMSTDNQSLYLSVGDIENQSFKVVPTKALNNKTGSEPDGTGGILHVTFNGTATSQESLDKTYPTNLYHAYGIRQSFGMDLDPLTGKLWDTENGANWGDEINLVEKGFNGGWDKVQGIWKDHIRDDSFNSSDKTYDPKNLFNFDGKGQYRSPEFIWKYTVGPTALKFMTTDKMGKEYKNDMFVGDVNNGRIYNFKLSENRTELVLKGQLADKVADSDSELDKVIFGGNFGIVTDLKVGPDGYLYFVVFDEGKIYRIVPRH